MEGNIKKYIMMLTAALGILLSTALPASAYKAGAEQEAEGNQDTGAAAENLSVDAGSLEEPPLTEEPSAAKKTGDGGTQGRGQDTAFSVPGNGQLADDIPGDGSKQFLTIQTRNGNTFFLMLDRSGSKENAYMLSMIDENDLAEFIGETKDTPEKEQPPAVILETEKPPAQEELKAEPEPAEKKGGMGAGAMLALAALLAGGIGGWYYFKVLKPGRDEDEPDKEDLEFYDGGAYINEDRKDSDDEGEEE